MPPQIKKAKVDFFQLLDTFKEHDALHSAYSSAWSKAYSSNFVESSILNVDEKFGLLVSKFGLSSVREDLII